MRSLGLVRFGGAALTLSSVALVVSATGALADNGTAAPVSGDSRATAVAGNATTCAGAGLTGSTVDGTQLVRDGQATVNGDSTMVTVNSLAPGTALVAIVVKGGDAYNVYQPGERGLSASPPYSDLHSPLVGQNKNVPTISHWFACTTQAGSTGGGSTGGGSTGGGSTGGTTGSGSTGTGGSPSGQVDSASTTPPGSNSKALAETGFDPTLPTVLGVLLLLAGLLVLVTPRRLVAAAGRLRKR